MTAACRVAAREAPALAGSAGGLMPPADQTVRGRIGVFDSGLGGLSVLQAVEAALPADELVYVADSAHAPYGEQPVEAIVARATALTRFLLMQRVEAIVVACNTASVLAAQALRAWCPVPVIALEPAIKPALQLSRSRVIGVMATRRTLESASVRRLCDLHGHGATVWLQPCPGLVECVEAGELNSAAVQALLRDHLRGLLQAGADTLVLGCTHYAFLRPAIRAVVGPAVQLIDSADAVARELVRRLGRPAQPAGDETAFVPRLRVYTTAAPATVAPRVSALLGRATPVESV
jgi:glutamate racemase